MQTEAQRALQSLTRKPLGTVDVCGLYHEAGRERLLEMGAGAAFEQLRGRGWGEVACSEAEEAGRGTQVWAEAESRAAAVRLLDVWLRKTPLAHFCELRGVGDCCSYGLKIILVSLKALYGLSQLKLYNHFCWLGSLSYTAPLSPAHTHAFP